MNDLIWPPEYTIRESNRAKTVGLRISSHKGLEVIIPKGFKYKKIQKLLTEKKSWIEKHLARLPKPTLPDTLNLVAINEIWEINYTQTLANKMTVILQPQQQLAIIGDIGNHASCNNVINKWLQKQGKLHLIPWLNKLSNDIGLKPNNVIIRNQTTRWGSCSAQNSISLNSKLLLLQSELVDYIMIHELCHIKQHNHSAKFWSLVERFQPDYQELRKQLRQMKL